QRVHQSSGGQYAPETTDRTNQKPTAAEQRQRLGRNQKWRCDPQAPGLRLDRRLARRAPAAVLPCPLQSLSQLPSSVCTSRSRNRRKGPPAEGLPPLPDAARDAARLAAAATIPAPGSHPLRLATHRRNPQRYRSRPAHAASQTQTVRAIARARGWAVEMTEENNPPNPRTGDYSLPWKAQTAKARFPHSHRPGC